MSGYVYELFDLNNNSLGWLPFDTTLLKAQFEYTILTKQFYDVGIDNEQINSSGDWVNLYPNPSTDEQTLGLFLQNSSKLSVGLYDVQGRLIKLVYEGEQNGGETKLKVDINSLSSGMYIYKIAAGDKVKSIQFIKQ